MEQYPAYSFDDPTLYLFTSLTAGSSHIITATSRLETILKANKIGFRAIDVATDDKARSLWGIRSKGKKLPGLVRYGKVVGDIEQIEEWNEYGELKDQLRGDPSSASNADVSPLLFSKNTPGQVPLPASTTSAALAPPSTTSSSPHIQIVGTPSRTPSVQSRRDDPLSLTLRQASEEAAAKAKEKAGSNPPPLARSTSASETKPPSVEKSQDTAVEGAESSSKVEDKSEESKPKAPEPVPTSLSDKSGEAKHRDQAGEAEQK